MGALVLVLFLACEGWGTGVVADLPGLNRPLYHSLHVFVIVRAA